MKKSVSYMAKRRIGALISIEKETGLNEYIETGIKMNAEISSELLINIFIPNTPLHDGAVVIRDSQIKAAACFLPLTQSKDLSKELGTRHRAAIGVSEVSDCISLIVSEETGDVSIAKAGKIYRKISKERMTNILRSNLKVTSQEKSFFKGGIFK
jgi:diadenylate cyclase